MLCSVFLGVKIVVGVNRSGSSIYYMQSFLIVAYRFLTPLSFERLDWVRLQLDFDNFSFCFWKETADKSVWGHCLCFSEAFLVRLKTLKWFLFLQNSPSRPFTGTEQFSYQLIIVIRIWPEINWCENNKDPC